MWDQGEECWIDLPANKPNDLLGLGHAPWSGAPNPTWLLGPIALRYIKWWGPAAQRTRFTVSQSAPPTNPKSDLVRVCSQRWEDATVITVGLTAPHRVVGLHRLFSDHHCPCAERHRQNEMAGSSSTAPSDGLYTPIHSPLSITL